MKFIWSGPLRCACTLTYPCPVYDNGNNSVSTATMERVKENPVRILSSLHFSWTRITCVMVRWQDLSHLAIETFYILYTVLKITITSYRWVVRRERTIFRYIQNSDRFIFMCVDDYYGLCVCVTLSNCTQIHHWKLERQWDCKKTPKLCFVAM